MLFHFSLLLLGCVTSQQLITETFISAPVTLYPGQIANTNPLEFPLLDWPQRKIAVRYFDSEVIDDDGNAVPLYDLYIHHYLIYVNYGKFNAGPCGIHNIWGIGAEMRGMVYRYPEPYAVVFDGSENITANFHFIRTDTVSDEDHQKCIECHCSDGTPNNPHGSITCCENEAFCWNMTETDQDPKNYYLKYTFKYTEVTEDVLPLTAYNYDVMSENNYDCSVEYQVPHDNVANGQYDVRRNTTRILQPTDIVLIEIHQHIGGVNYSIEHWRGDEYLGIVCSAEPIYGTGTQVGNEYEYVVKIPSCEFSAQFPYHVEKGDELVLTSVYNGRHIPGGGYYHEGVMGLLLYWGLRKGPSDCEATFKQLCGDPLPKNTQDCYECFEENSQTLYYSDCGAGYGWTPIQFLCLTDNGVKSPYPINETISIDDITNHMAKTINLTNITMDFNPHERWENNKFTWSW